MKKATHTGTCQICGATQKLPGGVLSKHGYTTRFNFFEGVCRGADHKPFELSIDLIEAAIDGALAKAADLEAQAAEYIEESSPYGLWHFHYVRGTNRSNTGYQWLRHDVSFEERTFAGGGTYLNAYWDTGERRRSEVPAPRGISLREAVPADYIRAARQPWHDHLVKQAAGLRAYAEWQRGRIEGWQPSELTEIK